MNYLGFSYPEDPCPTSKQAIAFPEVYILIEPVSSGKPLIPNHCVFEDSISLWKNKNGK